MKYYVSIHDVSPNNLSKIKNIIMLLKTKYDMLGPFASVDSSYRSTLRGNRGKLLDSEVYKKD